MLSRDTMKVHWIALLIVIGAALTASTVSAQVIEMNNGYIVSTADDITNDTRLPTQIPLLSSIITQGETHTYSRYVSSGTASMIADLNWGDISDSLSLTLIAPDATLGPYYDGADGQVDGRVFLRISKSPSLTAGTWWNRIYGYQVTGSEDYTFNSY